MHIDIPWLLWLRGRTPRGTGGGILALLVLVRTTAGQLRLQLYMLYVVGTSQPL